MLGGCLPSCLKECGQMQHDEQLHEVRWYQHERQLLALAGTTTAPVPRRGGAIGSEPGSSGTAQAMPLAPWVDHRAGRSRHVAIPARVVGFSALGTSRGTPHGTGIVHIGTRGLAVWTALKGTP